MQSTRRNHMKLKRIVGVAALGLVVLAAIGLVATAAAPSLEVGPSVVKVRNGKLVLNATCVGEGRCQSVLTARIDVKNGGLGGQIFRAEPGQTKKLVFSLAPNVRTWLTTHRRNTLVIEARTSNEDYQVVWRGTFRLKLHS
jgi:hypothetical protein